MLQISVVQIMRSLEHTNLTLWLIHNWGNQAIYSQNVSKTSVTQHVCDIVKSMPFSKPSQGPIHSWYLHHISIPHEGIIGIAAEPVITTAAVARLANCYKRAAPCAPPSQGARFGFGDAIQHNSQANTCDHVVFFMVTDIQSCTKQPDL